MSRCASRAYRSSRSDCRYGAYGPDTSGPYFKTAEWAGTAKVGQLLEAGLKSEKDDALRTLVADMQKNKVNTPAVTAFIAAAA